MKSSAEDTKRFGLNEMAIFPDHITIDVLSEIKSERYRQYHSLEKKGIPTDCADPQTSNGDRLSVLGEEFGEVCKAINEGGDIYNELIQVAAVSVAWAEGLIRNG
jgi:nucleosome binding factor SPN SPT16 subunit